MSFDFDRLTDRRDSFSYKWDVLDGELPMWVADMDFEVAPPIREAVVRRAEHGIFGYSTTPDELFTAVSGYFERRHGFSIPVEWMVYSSGIVAAISSMVRKLTTPAEQVLVCAPVYNIFYNSILNNGRRVISSDLVYENGGYSIDFCDLEDKLAQSETSLMILCNPHNPVGKLWTADELSRIGELCHRHGVTVISDEIHCDLVDTGCAYVPFCSVNDLCAEISVSCIAASKTFNIAGLQSAIIVAKNPHLRHRVWRGINTDEVGEPNAFAVCANIAALSECDEWVDEVCRYVFENRHIAETFIDEKIPVLRAVRAKATYLLWIDISGLGIGSVEFCHRLRELTGLYLSDGEEYGECGKYFVRMNLATQRERLFDGLSRLMRGVNTVLEEKV